MGKKKLIEVALPLDKINEAASYEKMPGIGAHPRGVHIWWARRPFTTCRAMIWASIIDDPSEHPELFPTEEDQNKERERLFHILDDLADWNKSDDENVIEAAKKEIQKNTKGETLTLLDPFSGGGAIPFEAQRLGLKVIAHDLNPIAVMINKSMTEIPVAFSNMAPVNPSERVLFGSNERLWENCHGLASDIKYYGEWIRNKAEEKIGKNYPLVKLPSQMGGGYSKAIAWLWVRTVKCPNPACGVTIPLASKYVLASKKGREVWAEPIVTKEGMNFIVHYGKCPKEKESDKLGRNAVFKCPCCGEVTTDAYVKKMGMEHKIGKKLMAVVAENKGGRVYVSPSIEQELAAEVERPKDVPDAEIPNNPRWFSPPVFGMKRYSDIFTNRQLVAMNTFCNLIEEARTDAEKLAIQAGMPNDHIPLSKGGNGALAYSQAIKVYLAFAIDRLACFSSSCSPWASGNEKAMNCFGRQALAMTWDYPEVNVLGNSVGSITEVVNYIADCIATYPKVEHQGIVEQYDAQSDYHTNNVMISTDPPYYDNIGYADLSDFFYVWMRHNLRDIYPDIFATMKVPKAQELVATPYRFEGSVEKARKFFEDGMLEACKRIYQYAREDIPVTIYYAYKQSSQGSNKKQTTVTSSGWVTMLTAIIKAGFAITGTWPVRTEMTMALKANVNALASSIVLVCRKRPQDAPQTTRRNLINTLRRELRPALKKLQDSNIAPVDLAQSAIGPGMGVFSRYRKVLEADGTEMTVSSALDIINEEIDLYFNEQVGDLDAASRFCVELYTQTAYNDIKYGEAEVLANAKGTSIPMMASHGVLYAKAGTVHLIERNELPEKIDHDEANIWLLTQQLTRAMTTGGVENCAQIIAPMYGSNAERAKELAYRLYTIAEQKNWAQEAYVYNALVVAWPDIQSRAAAIKAVVPKQMSLFDLGLNENK